MIERCIIAEYIPCTKGPTEPQMQGVFLFILHDTKLPALG